MRLQFFWENFGGKVQLFRGDLSYDLFDAFSIGGGLLVYNKGEDSEYPSVLAKNYANQISQNDQIYFEVSYSL